MLENIRSKYILQKIFDYLKNKKKLKLIKCNKKILDDLNISKDDFQKYKTLKEFNKKYSTFIDDIDTKKLHLQNIKLDNEGLECLIKLKFKNLEILKLINDNIPVNNISENIYFNNLKELYLRNMNLTNIEFLEKIKFQSLEVLDLTNNRIVDIKVLKDEKFKGLKKLLLENNNVGLNVKELENVKFDKLEILNLSGNRIPNIKFENLDCEELKELDLSWS